MDRFGGLSVGSVVAFLTYYRAVHMPITQVSQQFNSIVMALAGAERVFDLMDEKPEPDEGYVTLVNAKEKDGNLVETPDHTGRWAWKHYHKADDICDSRSEDRICRIDRCRQDDYHKPDKQIL